MSITVGASAWTAREYETYIGSGHYDHRYPIENARVMECVRHRLPPGGDVLDYGCGTGRYAVPLARGGARVVALDVCEAALRGLRGRARETGVADAIETSSAGPEAIVRAARERGGFDVVLCLFGVLSHIVDPDERRAVLRAFGDAASPKGGSVVVSVPNRMRRFASEQRAQRSGHGAAITYERRIGKRSLHLPYKLYDPASLREELEGAGLVVETIVAESLLPESVVTRRAAARALELVTPLVPARLGYGLLAVARPERRGGT